MKEGLIELDMDRAETFGFTSDKFDGWLWLKDGYVYISFIISLKPNQGNLAGLFSQISSLGYGIKVPTPFAKMKAILTTHAFHKTKEYSNEMHDDVEVWVKNR